MVVILGALERGHPFFCTTYSVMNVLDLHGKTHAEARFLVEEFVLINETPLKIITGNSNKMKIIVKEIVEKHEMYYYPEHFSNFGAYIIQDKTLNQSIYG
tara:strand:- start:5058 stop:5357 length:300 start_codon:yes stop_codon:yes gene_type:complete